MAEHRFSLLRRLVQFRLRTMLLAVFLLSLALGWYVRRVELQRRAAEAIRQAGGTVHYDFDFFGGENDIFDYGINTTDSDIRKARKNRWVPEYLQARLGDDYFHAVAYAELQPAKHFDRTVLDRLADLPRLQLLVVEGLDDRDMQVIGRQTQLRGLVITEAGAITDEGIAQLADMTKLEMIALHGGPNRLRAGQQHHQPVDADAQAAGGGHAVLEGADKVVVHLGHRLFFGQPRRFRPAARRRSIVMFDSLEDSSESRVLVPRSTMPGGDQQVADLALIGGRAGDLAQMAAGKRFIAAA